MALRLSTGLANYIARTGSLKAGIDNCYLLLYTGSQPANADAAATGTLLATISAAGVSNAELTIIDGTGTGDVQKAAEVWQGTGLADGVIGWFRLIVENVDEATTIAEAGTVSTTSRRIDGSVAASGAQLNISNTTVATGAPQLVSSFTVTLPQAA